MLTQEDYADLKQYIPESDQVKITFAELHPEEDFSDWDATLNSLICKAVGEDGKAGDNKVLLDLLDLAFTSGHNEGMLESITDEV